MRNRTKIHLESALTIKDKIIDNYSDLLEHPKRKLYLELLNSINKDTIYAINFRRPNWGSTEKLQELTFLFEDLKEHINICQKRDCLSITPKVEDIKVVYKWAETFNVPRFYCQVFFDKSYGISFKDILTLLTEPEKEGEFYEISKDIKNQNKTTIKINTRNTKQIAYKISEPEHSSVRKEMGRGRLLFFVSFKGGNAYLDVDNLRYLLGINKQEF
jgi:type II restriction enzyme